MRYLFFLIFCQYTRKIESIIIPKVIYFKDSLSFALLMFSGEFLGGLGVIFYQNLSFLNSNKQTKQDEVIVKILTKGKGINKMSKKDNMFIIILLIFFAAFFDYTQFIVSYILPEIAILSPTSDNRLCILQTITSSLLCIYALKFKIGKHHIFSLIGMSICLSIILVLDIIYLSRGTDAGKFILAFLLVFVRLSFISFIDVIERYLVEYNNMNKFKILSTEGIFGIILCVVFALVEEKNPFKEMNKTYTQLNDRGKKFLMIFFLVLYFILSAGINIYKLICNVIYTPIVKSLSAYILNPLLIIYYFIWENDFKSKGEKNYFYFILNIILSLIIDFFALIYNEFFILYCCKLEQGTHFAISNRAENNRLKELEMLDDDIERTVSFDEYYLNANN